MAFFVIEVGAANCDPNCRIALLVDATLREKDEFTRNDRLADLTDYIESLQGNQVKLVSGESVDALSELLTTHDEVDAYFAAIALAHLACQAERSISRLEKARQEFKMPEDESGVPFIAKTVSTEQESTRAIQRIKACSAHNAGASWPSREPVDQSLR